MAEQTESPRYIPAARWKVLTRYFDLILAVTMREKRFRAATVDRLDAELPENGRVVDVGCGTGTLAIALAERRTDAKVIGVDGDPEILYLARAKPGADRIEWKQGLAGMLPFEDGSIDVVTISLVLHHLLPDEKREALREAKRILKDDGSLNIVDWGKPTDLLMSGVFYVAQAIDGFDRTADHRAGRLPQFINEAGFSNTTRYGGMRTGFGSLEYLVATPRTG